MVMRREVADPTGKRLGLAVFLLGIVLLLFVFYRGFVELAQAGLPASLDGGQNPPKPFEGFVLNAFTKWILLFLLAYVASTLAGRGITLYQAARALFGEEG